jgi:hypothetical protein
MILPGVFLGYPVQWSGNGLAWTFIREGSIVLAVRPPRSYYYAHVTKPRPHGLEGAWLWLFDALRSSCAGLELGLRVGRQPPEIQLVQVWFGLEQCASWLLW